MPGISKEEFSGLRSYAHRARISPCRRLQSPQWRRRRRDRSGTGPFDKLSTPAMTAGDSKPRRRYAARARHASATSTTPDEASATVKTRRAKGSNLNRGLTRDTLAVRSRMETAIDDEAPAEHKLEHLHANLGHAALRNSQTARSA
jgi:hypothetical protein